MAKRYYWLKLKEDFFDDETISYIEEQENGVYYVNFYLKLCLKSIKTEGKLIRLVGETLIPYDVNSLSRLTETPVDTVMVAMKLFESIGIVKVLETGEIYLSQIDEMIGSETDKAAIMRRKRAKEKISGNKVTQKLLECYTEKEKDIDIEIEKDNINYKDIVNAFNDTCVSFPKVKKLSNSRKKAIRARLNTYSIDEIKKVFELAEQSDFLKGKNDRNWTATFDWMMKDSNMAKILDGNYRNKETQIVSQKKNYNMEHQRDYDFDDIEKRLMERQLGY